MRIEPLDVDGAWLCSPPAYDDDRGTFVEWFRADHLQRATGRRFTPVQANHSVSRRGVIRGLHYADVPPGQAKYVYCPRGAVLDVAVDLREGSPTFGRHTAVRLDAVDRQGVFLSEGLGHAFCALTDDADVVYLVSTAYDPGAEHTIDPYDVHLGLPWPGGRGEHRLSPKDAAAPGLAAVRAAGLLPSYEVCRQHPAPPPR